VAGVHGLKHVQGFRTSALSNNDAVRAHPQCVFDQVSDLDGTLAFDVAGAALQADQMIMVQLELCRVFNRDME
jgi:uncharacterized protein YhdP